MSETFDSGMDLSEAEIAERLAALDEFAKGFMAREFPNFYRGQAFKGMSSATIEAYRRHLDGIVCDEEAYE